MASWLLLLMEEGVFWAKDRRELAAACAATMAQVLNDVLDPQVWQYACSVLSRVFGGVYVMP